MNTDRTPHLLEALTEIAELESLTATPTQFYKHLQRIARRALAATPPEPPTQFGYYTWDFDAGKYALRGIIKPLPACGACRGDGSICQSSCRLADESPPIAALTPPEPLGQP